MTRLQAIFLLALLAASVLAGPQQPATLFRHAHDLLILAEKGKPFRLTLYAVSASLGYPDPLQFRLCTPRGKTLESGTLPPGSARTLEITPAMTGTYRLVANPERNAFGVMLEGAVWLVEMREGRLVEVIDRAAPLYVHVPRGVSTLVVTGSGEAAKIQLVDPRGQVAAEERYPNYEKATLRAGVPPEMAGKPWQLRLELAQDCALRFEAAVAPYLSETPITAEVLERLQGGLQTVTFDRQLTDRQALMEQAGSVATRLEAGAGLTLPLDSAGRVVPPKDAGAAGGFLLRDYKEDGLLLRPSLKVQGTAKNVRLVGGVPEKGLTLEARLRSERRAIWVGGTLADTTGRDRAITLYFALPVPRAGARWWIGLDEWRSADIPLEQMEGAPLGVGSAGFHSTYPWGCITGSRNTCLAIPIHRPCLHRIGYHPAAQLLYLALDFALTPATRQFPQRADFEFVIYPVDSEWGFRSAAERYYQLFPDSFASRIKEIGGWVCWDTLQPLGDVRDLGFLYHWGPGGPAAVKWDDEHGIYSFLYNDSCRFFADIGAYEQRPSAAEVERVFREYLTSPDPAAFVKSRPDSATGKQRYQSLERQWGAEAAAAYLRRCVAAVARSAAEDAEGHYITGYVINRKDWGPPNWWTGRLHCNIAPDLEGGYGRFLLDEIIFRTFEEYEKAGAHLDGVGLDNYFVNARFLDYRRDHFAAARFPLTFATADGRPVAVGDFVQCEWVAELRKRLGPQRALIANLGTFPFPFAAHLLDIHGYEWNIERVAPVARTLAYHKPVVTLPVREEHYQEPFLRAHLRFAAIPGGYGGTRFNQPELRALYRRYVPVLLRLNRAGWEPVPHARADHPNIFIERFGPGKDGDLLYTVHSSATEPVAVRITLWPQAMGWRAPVSHLQDLFSGKEIPVSSEKQTLSMALTLAAGETKVLAFEGRR